jgi:hypothetical protein
MPANYELNEYIEATLDNKVFRCRVMKEPLLVNNSYTYVCMVEGKTNINPFAAEELVALNETQIVGKIEYAVNEDTLSELHLTELIRQMKGSVYWQDFFIMMHMQKALADDDDGQYLFYGAVNSTVAEAEVDYFRKETQVLSRFETVSKALRKYIDKHN